MLDLADSADPETRITLKEILASTAWGIFNGMGVNDPVADIKDIKG